MRVALVHDWLITWRGGEKVLAALAAHFPEAPIYTLFHQPGSMAPTLEARHIVTSVLDRVPGARTRHRWLLPALPAAIRSLRLPPVDVVISSSHCVAKAVGIPPGAKHLSYVHAPLRYMWDRFDDYFGPGRAGWPLRLAARLSRPAFQAWDVVSSAGVDRFVANSSHVAQQISDRYHRHAAVVHPPVELERFTSGSLEGTGQGGYFLMLGALAPYKRVDLAIEAFARLGLPLWVGGTGQDAERLRRRVPPNVRVLGPVSDDALPKLYRDARALIFPGVEDFGLTPLEANASGRPVIALRQGGVRDSLREDTAVFFDEQTAQGLEKAVRSFDGWERGFRPEVARANALRFGTRPFLEAIDRELAVLLGR